MIVSNDILELPRSLPMTLDEMVAYTGLTRGNIIWLCSPTGIKRMAKAAWHVKDWKIIAFNEEKENDT